MVGVEEAVELGAACLRYKRHFVFSLGNEMA